MFSVQNYISLTNLRKISGMFKLDKKKEEKLERRECHLGPLRGKSLFLH
jgi:hypothetical protein